MNVSPINKFSPVAKIGVQKPERKSNELMPKQSHNVQFNGFKSAGKGALFGGLYGAVMLATFLPGAAYTALCIAHNVVCGAIIGHFTGAMFEKDDIPKTLQQDDKK